jgi:5,10-methylene-tetrahydrofolate dehydrogenase/methenyl tetrahydrofolate cyclohydrolase
VTSVCTPSKLELPATTTQAELLGTFKLNADPAIHGILVQSPPPKHIDEAAIVRAIDPAKDVDGFHPVNVAKLALEDPRASSLAPRSAASACSSKPASRRKARMPSSSAAA